MVNGRVRGTYILLNSKMSMLMKMIRCKRARKRCVFFEIPKDPAVLYVLCFCISSLLHLSEAVVC